MTLPTIITTCLWSTMVWCQQDTTLHASHLIHRLNDIYRFDQNILLMDTSTDLDRWFIKSTSLSKWNAVTPQTVFTFDYSFEYDEHALFAKLKMVASKNTFVLVMVSRLTTQNSLHIMACLATIRKLNYEVKIGVFVTRSGTSLQLIEEFFRGSWSVRIVHST